MNFAIWLVLQSMYLYILYVLASPKWVLKVIWNLQHTFLCGGTKTKSKWALVKWDTIFKPKSLGGLGIRDHEVNNAVPCAKIWWNWTTINDSPWAHLWNSKYVKYWSTYELIKYDLPLRYQIWKAANSQRNLIQQHCVWEVKDGTSANFWTDS